MTVTGVEIPLRKAKARAVQSELQLTPFVRQSVGQLGNESSSWTGGWVLAMRHVRYLCWILSLGVTSGLCDIKFF